MAPLYNGWPYNGVKYGQHRATEEEQEQKQKGDGWALSHPANGLLATLSEKGWPRDHLQGLPADSFSRFWAILGSF